MNRCKIIHAADMHIGRSLNYLSTDEDLRRIEILNTFKKVIDLANDEGVSLILFAGDLFEASSISNSYIESVISWMESFNGYIVISPGNHDYVSLGSVYNNYEFPQNVHIFKENRLDKFVFEDLKVCVFGAAFNHSYEKEGLIKDDIVVNPEYINILLVHGDLVKLGGQSNYNPVEVDNLADKGIDYLALGHIHKRSPVEKKGGFYYAYPGSTIGQSFDDCGEKGVYGGYIGKLFNDLKFIRIDNPQFYKDQYDIGDLENQEEIALGLKKYLNDKYAYFEKNFYKIDLIGKKTFENKLDVAIIKNKLRDLRYIDIEDKTRPFYDYDKMSKENSLRGIFVKQGLKKMDGKNNKRIEAILELGLRALSDEL